MGTYTSNHSAYGRWINHVHCDPNWRSPTAERNLLTVPVIPGYQTLPPTQMADSAPDDRMTLGQWFLALGGLIVVIMFLLAVFLPVFI